VKIEDLVKAAQKYDLENRPYRQNWQRVPDSQVARLLTGARIAKEQEQRQATPVTEGG
jgi:hypothetical protein